MSAHTLQAQLLCASSHRILGLAREIRDDLSAGHPASALEDLARLRLELAEALAAVEALDSEIAAAVHHECLTCGLERAAGRLQCPACEAETEHVNKTVAAAIAEIRRPSPTNHAPAHSWPTRSYR